MSGIPKFDDFNKELDYTKKMILVTEFLKTKGNAATGRKLDCIRNNVIERFLSCCIDEALRVE